MTLPQRLGYRFDVYVMICVETETAMQHYNRFFRQIANYAITSEQFAHPAAILYSIDCNTCQPILKPTSVISVAQDWARLESKDDGKVNRAGGDSSRKDSNDWPEWEKVKEDQEFEQ